MSEQPHIVNRLDVAVDFIVRSAESAMQLKQFLDRHLTQPWRGKRVRNQYEGEGGNTTYFSRIAATRRNIAIYADKPSKVTGEPCAHVELRYIGVKACERRGVNEISDFRDFDLERWFQHDLRLSVIDWARGDKKLEQAIEEQTTRLMRRHADRAQETKRVRTIYDKRINRELARKRVLNHYLRCLQDETGIPDWDKRENFPVQDCIDLFRVLRSYVRQIPVTELLGNPRLHGEGVPGRGYNPESNEINAPVVKMGGVTS